MAIFNISASDQGFSMLNAGAVNDTGASSSGNASQYNYLSTVGHRVRLSSATSNFTYDGSGDPTGGTATSGTIDLDNDDALNPDIIFSGFSGGLVAMTGGFSGFYNAILGGDDTVTGSAFDDTLRGLGGDDEIFGGAGDDVIDAGAGVDYVVPGAGQDDSDGGTGIDFLDLSLSPESGAIIDLTTGVVDFGAYSETHVNYEQFQGTTGADSVIGSAGFDDVTGHNGDDTISAGDASDTVNGGGGDDVLLGGTGFDFLFGSDGADIIRGGSVADTILGGNHNDNLAGQGGSDSLDGGAGDDVIRGNVGVDMIDGGSGADAIAGRAGADTLNGGTGDDFLTGKGGADVHEFDLGSGADTIRTFVAGAGVVDVIRLSGFGAAFDTFAEVMAAMTTDGVNTFIDFGADTLTVKGVVPSAFNADDFQFI